MKIFNSAQAQRKTKERASQKLNKAQKETCSQSFINLIPLLEEKKWKYYKEATVSTATGVGGMINIIKTQTLVLDSENFSLALSSYKDGVNFGKLEVWKKGIDKIQEAKSIILAVMLFLKEQGVSNLYAITAFVGHIKETDVVLDEFQLKKLYRELGFQETKINGVLKLPNYDIISKYDNIDLSLLIGVANDISIDNNSVYFEGQVQVYFEFANDSSKNFTRTFYVGSDEDIREQIKLFISKVKDESEDAQMLKRTLQLFLEENTKVPFEMKSQLFQTLMGVSLAQAAKDFNYKHVMTYSTNFFISVLHLLINGNKKQIVQYRLLFDEKRETMDIATRGAA